MTTRQQRDKKAAFAKYGTECLHCGIADMEVLTIDHTNQDGAIHRKEANIKNGQALYRWLRQNDYPPDFRTLCFNCNIKAFRQHQRNLRK